MLRSQNRKNPREFLNRTLTRALVLLGLLVMSTLTMTAVTVSSRSIPAGSNAAGAAAGDRVGRRNARITKQPTATKARAAAGPLMPLVSITVDRTDDAPSASACTAAANDCSLRGAISFANTNPVTTINIPSGSYQLAIPGGFAEGFSGDNSVGDLDVTGNNTSVVGAGAATTTIQQTQPNDRVLEVNPFLDAGFNFSISGVTITGGKETTAVGGGGIICGSIDNVTSVSNSIISGNSATGAGTFGGGGISCSGGSLSITGTTFSSNSTSASGGGLGYSAGDPLGRTPATGTLTISGSTFSGNSAGSAAAGGGAADLFDFNASTGTYSINTSSFSNNTANSGSGGAIIVESGPLTVITSSLSNNHAGNTGGAISSSGSASVSFSRLVGNTATTPTNGMTLFSSNGAFTADDNWWGINTGPSLNDFRTSTGSIAPATYLQLEISASPNTICTGQTSSLTADIKKRNAGPSLTTELNGLPAFPVPSTVIFNNAVLGTLSGASTQFVDGVATANYTAGATPGSGSADATGDNQTVTVSIQVQATTTSDPADQAVCQGATATFSTVGGGPGTFHYAWTLDGSPFNGDSASINVPTGSLSFGAHTVVVTTTGACGSATQTATLTIQENTATTDPADQAVCQGATASFSTTASGAGPFHYAWTLDGSPFDGDNPSISVPTGSLSVGNHTVVVTTSGTCGSATQSATLTVQETTSTSDPADQTVCQGATANFATTASGSGPFHYAWTLDGSPFDGDNSSISVLTGSLSVGNHTVAVTTSGTCGSSTQSATLTVQATTSTTDPTDQAVCPGGTANFSTTASGTGPFHYAWTLDGSPFNGDNASISVPTGSLSSGNHTVVVTTSGTCGSATQSATLTVFSAPVVTTNPVSQSATSGTVTFTAAASGNPTPTVQWQVSTNGGATFSNIPGETNTSLNVTVSPAVNGNQYRAVFTNSCGSATTTAATLTTCSPPVINLSTTSIAMWPPNHAYRTFNVADFVSSATSNCFGDLTSSVVIASVSSDEPENGGGDGNTLNDIVIAANCKSVDLRSERNGAGNGRVYTITFKVTDALGVTTTATVKVTVPISQNGAPAVDNGPSYVVNSSCP